jgi:16S rRNA (cytidine1402-2'-O)-methyltransferase
MGNLEDITQRALRVLREVDLIAAEDTRHTRILLQHYAIKTPLLALHEHNEIARVEPLLEQMRTGVVIALVSDAGTPLISDPGFPLVREAIHQGFNVVPIPGPCASICALSAAGLPTHRFLFVGFPPRQAKRRQQWLKELATQSATLIFYESSHRLLATLADMQAVFGAQREAVIARELTKLHETFLSGPLTELRERVQQDPNQQKGEFVLLIHGVDPRRESMISLEMAHIIEVLGSALPVKQAASLAAKLTGEKKNDIYQRILKNKS